MDYFCLFDKDYNFIRKVETLKKDGVQAYGVTTNSKSEMLISDYNNNIISVYNVTGELMRTFNDTKQGGQLNLKEPRGLVCDDNDNIYVADYWNDRIVVIKDLRLLVVKSHHVILELVKFVLCSSISLVTNYLLEISVVIRFLCITCRTCRTMQNDGSRIRVIGKDTVTSVSGICVCVSNDGHVIVGDGYSGKENRLVIYRPDVEVEAVITNVENVTENIFKNIWGIAITETGQILVTERDRKELLILGN